MASSPRETSVGSPSRRDFLKTSGGAFVASALAGAAVPYCHAAESSTIKLALVGCGGRGTGAVADAFAATGGPVQLYAMADVFDTRLEASKANLSRQFADKVNVPAERSFIGFDAYKKAIDSLGPGDVVMLTTPAAALRVRRAKGRQRLHGKVVRRGLAGDTPHLEGCRGFGEEEPEGRLRFHVAALQGARGGRPPDL